MNTFKRKKSYSIPILETIYEKSDYEKDNVKSNNKCNSNYFTYNILLPQPQKYISNNIISFMESNAYDIILYRNN